jgi:hypothetical protein
MLLLRLCGLHSHHTQCVTLQYSTVQYRTASESQQTSSNIGSREERRFYNTILLILPPKIAVQSMHEKHRIQNTVEYKRLEQNRTAKTGDRR